ncbi:MAG: DUF1501 domain-containing protein [Planctomycetota bacterium]
MSERFGSSQLSLTRRTVLGGAMGVGSLALASMLGAQGEPPRASIRSGQTRPRAKSVIFVHLVGAPSHLDLFDHKPELKRRNGELVPKHLIEGQRFAFLRGHPKLLGSRFRFDRVAGLELSELLPHLQTVAEDIAVVKTLGTEEFNHAPAQLFFETGFERFGRPSIGAWTTYGLGSMSRDLPGFVVLTTGATAGAGNSLWGAGFLPSVHQGVAFRKQGDPVLFLSDPKGLAREERRGILDAIGTLNRRRFELLSDPEIETRIAQYEMAYRMQTSVPELSDLRSEPRSTLEMYGASPGKASFANHCLLARRLVEQGVRFVQLYDSGWDHHGGVFTALPKKCREVDRPLAALIRDLKSRGLLDETLVVWGSEFGRTPMVQGGGNNPGRDHHKDAYSVWLAGGGVRGGECYGRTDELGYHAIESSVSVRDLHATILAILGIDHEALTYRFQGRDFRLTDVSGRVMDGILA